jgi:hypothetical protein
MVMPQVARRCTVREVLAFPVDHEAGVVNVWTPDDDRPAIVTDTLRWRVAPEAPELEIDIAELLEGLPG